MVLVGVGVGVGGWWEVMFDNVAAVARACARHQRAASPYNKYCKVSQTRERYFAIDLAIPPSLSKEEISLALRASRAHHSCHSLPAAQLRTKRNGPASLFCLPVDHYPPDASYPHAPTNG